MIISINMQKALIKFNIYTRNRELHQPYKGYL